MIPAALGSARLGWLALALLLVVAVVIAALVALPLLRGADAAPEVQLGAAELELQRAREDLDRSLSALREIAFDNASGNLSEGDFESLDAAERAHAVRLMRRIDELEG